MTPEELLLEAEKDLKDGVLPRQWKLERHLLDYREHLQKQDFAPLTIKSRMSGIYSFYQTYNITLPKLPRNEKRAKPLKQHMDIPTKEDLQIILRHCDELEKTLVLIGASSGLGANELCNLTIGDFRKGYDPETGVTTLQLRREKVDCDFITFLSPEASQAVHCYLDFRARETKSNKKNRHRQLAKQRVYDDSGYLLIRRNVPEKYLETHNEKLRQLTGKAPTEIYRKLAEKAHKNTPPHVWGLIRSHNVRKIFNSSLLNAGADPFFVEYRMGHTLDDTRSAYFRASPIKLKEIYLKFVPYLTIQKEMDISVSPEYLRVMQEKQILQAETERHIVERSELQELREENEKNKKQMKEYEKLIEEIKENTLKLDERMTMLSSGDMGEWLPREKKKKQIKKQNQQILEIKENTPILDE